MTNNIKNNPMWAFLFGQVRSCHPGVPDALVKVPLFDHLSKRELRIVTGIIHHRTYQEGEFVFQKGQPGAAMFIIDEGEIEIVDPDQDEKCNVIARLGENTFFGELALLDDSPRSATAVAVKLTRIYAFFRADLDDLMNSNPHIGSHVYKSLAMIIGARLKATNEQLFNK
ncbi:MAG: cyclic nucleotide-binding domain-containing protein [Proteobacteria bacterium]|nr:cyclic nucleotide-binding domain-containing protein [Pseudomonadota bacterium]MBU1715376.1 cyclic nucleotide-binding domain-containing protein [Pseudomonadota bacterium]